MPISTMAPLTARMLYCLIRGTIALLATFAVGYAFGFRMFGGLGYLITFTALVLLLTLGLSLGADAIGVRVSNAQIGKTGGASQILLVPQMLLVILSSGMAPVDSFPDWLHGFVRYQPVSQITGTLRGLAAGDVDAGSLVTSMAWCGGMVVVFGAIAIRMQRRIP
jgi:ABC-2 type transport system permease protein